MIATLDTLPLVVKLLIGLGLGLAAFYVFAMLCGLAESMESSRPPETYTGDVRQINRNTVQTTVQGRTFDIIKSRDEIFVQEVTGGRISSPVRIGSDCYRFGKTKAQAAIGYIKTVVDEGHRVP